MCTISIRKESSFTHIDDYWFFRLNTGFQLMKVYFSILTGVPNKSHGVSIFVKWRKENCARWALIDSMYWSKIISIPPENAICVLFQTIFISAANLFIMSAYWELTICLYWKNQTNYLPINFTLTLNIPHCIAWMNGWRVNWRMAMWI